MTGWKIGSATVTPVIELTLPVPGTLLIPQATPEALAPYADWLRPGYMTEQGQINLTIQAFLVESRGRKIIVDTCVGNGKTRPAAVQRARHAFPRSTSPTPASRRRRSTP